MRMQDRICNDKQKIEELLSSAETGFLGLANNDVPYVVPLNFVWFDGSIYFHGASEGKKVDFINNNSVATFVISEFQGTMVSPIPANTDTAYLSVMLFGDIEFVNTLSEATNAMQVLLDKYVAGYYNTPLSSQHVARHQSSLGSKTCIFKLNPTEITAKENIKMEDQLYFQGRNVSGETSSK